MVLKRERSARGRRDRPVSHLDLMRMSASPRAAMSIEDARSRYRESRDAIIDRMRDVQPVPYANTAALLVARYDRDRAARAEARALLRACGDTRRVRT